MLHKYIEYFFNSRYITEYLYDIESKILLQKQVKSYKKNIQ